MNKALDKQARLELGDSTTPFFWDVCIMEYRQRQLELNKWRKVMETAPYPHNFDTTYELWLEYKDRGVLPFTGGWLNQPQWMLDDFHYYDLLKEYASLPYLIADAEKERLRVLKL